MRSERWIIHVHERPAAVERVLGTLRRRAIDVSDLSVARASGSSLVVNVAVRVEDSVAARVTAELEASPDTIEVERTGRGLPPEVAPSDDHGMVEEQEEGRQEQEDGRQEQERESHAGDGR